MRMKQRGSIVITLILLAGVLGWQPSFAQTSGSRYFPETGHSVTADFFTAYQSVKDPLLLFGYPITEAYQDQTTGLIVQYFQRARFELHPEAAADLRVQLTPLGRYLYTPGPLVPVPSNFPACQFFPETGFQVCFAFLDFFNAEGGVAQFGYPISNFESHDDRIVQYFQRARFEWHPEYPSGQRVTLTDLGSRYFDTLGENPARLLAIKDSNTLDTILSLKVHAYPGSAVTALKGSQLVSVIVQDQNLRPVSGAPVSFDLTLPGGHVEHFVAPPTNEYGISQLPFQFEADSLGSVNIKVQATYAGLQGNTVTSFRIWW